MIHESHHESTLNAIVLLPDGMKVISTDGKLLTEAKASYMGSDPIIYAVPIVSPGHFRLKVYEGIRITINAYLNDGRDKQIYSDPIQIAETGDYKNLKLVIPVP